MADYFQVEAGVILMGPVPRSDIRHPNTSISPSTTDAELKALGYLPQIKVGDDSAFDPTIERLSGPANMVNADDVTSTWTVEPLTAQEQLGRQAILDADFVEKAGRKDAVNLLVRLIQILIDNGTITGADYSPSDVKLFQDVKQRIDRLYP